MRRLTSLPLAVAAGLVLLACGGGSVTGGSATGGSGSGATPTPAATAGSGSSSDLGAIVSITETEFKLDPATVSVQAGRVTFELADKGTAPHDLHIAPKGSSSEVGASQRMVAGGTATLTVTLPAGTYDMWCGVPGHRQAGMQGTITVT